MIDYLDDRLPERFWEKVYPEPNTGCWLWGAHISDTGYGVLWYERRPRRAHRVSYINLVGPIPEKLVIDHKCRVRACVNPLHLEPVTYLENLLRGLVGTSTHCKQGHEWAPENTRRTSTQKRCRACVRQIQITYRARKRLEAA